MTIRVEDVEEPEKEPEKSEEKEPAPKRRGRPLGSKDKTKRVVRKRKEEPQEPRKEPREEEPRKEEPVMTYQEQKRAYLRQVAEAQAARHEAKKQRFAAMLEKSLPY